ncbi:transporter [Massilia sp. YIM B04103]|uniref:transporter n=1 Tax=Massilia sp. YIM B04103 TaxID=2963106 RepID=UPI00210BD73F|nr:transporter [Massilia sp. YIM B04103]
MRHAAGRGAAPFRRLAAVLLMTVGAALAWPAQAAEDGPPPVLPYRPSVSSPASLPAPGQLEMEVGGLRSRDEGTRRASLPMLLKLAFNEEWGVLLGGEAWISARAPDSGRQRGVGDLTATLKRALRLDEASVLGLELSAKAPTARDGLGSGKSDYGLNGIYSRDFGSLHMDANLNLLRLGRVDEGEGRLQKGLSAAFSLPVAERWGATAELSGTQRHGSGATAQLLLAAAYNPHARLAFDVGVAKGLNARSQDWSMFAGVVFPLANFR